MRMNPRVKHWGLHVPSPTLASASTAASAEEKEKLKSHHQKNRRRKVHTDETEDGKEGKKEGKEATTEEKSEVTVPPTAHAAAAFRYVPLDRRSFVNDDEVFNDEVFDDDQVFDDDEVFDDDDIFDDDQVFDDDDIFDDDKVFEKDSFVSQQFVGGDNDGDSTADSIHSHSHLHVPVQRHSRIHPYINQHAVAVAAELDEVSDEDSFDGTAAVGIEEDAVTEETEVTSSGEELYIAGDTDEASSIDTLDEDGFSVDGLDVHGADGGSGGPDLVDGTTPDQYAKIPDPEVTKLTPYKIVTALYMMIAGIMLLFFGHRLFKPVLFVSGFNFTALFVSAILHGVSNRTGNYYSDSVYFISALVTGIIGGLLFMCFWRAGVFTVGALLGYSISTIILSFVSNGTIPSVVGRTAFILTLSFTLGLGILFFERYLLIPSTSIPGALLFCLGVDLFARTGLVDAQRLFVSGQGGFRTNPGFYGLLSALILLAVIGGAVQAFIANRMKRRMTVGSDSGASVSNGSDTGAGLGVDGDAVKGVDDDAAAGGAHKRDVEAANLPLLS